MSITEIFKILQIPETRQEQNIRAAYHRLLTGVNPEDDPEGFKRLRKAYEEALVYARTPEQETDASEVEWLQDQEVGKFLKQLADIYNTYQRRIDLEEWKGLLADPVLSSLDDGENAKWGMFSYLAEYYSVPDEVWELLDAEYFIQENQKEMKEHLSEAFVNYVIQKLERETKRSAFPYEKLTGPSHADHDGFFEAYSNFIRENFEDNQEGLAQKGRCLEELSAYGLSHPWYELNKAEYQMQCGNTERAAELTKKLIEENSTDEYIWLTGAKIMDACGEKAYALDLWTSYLDWEEQTRYGKYQALFALAVHEASNGQWEKAYQLSDKAENLRDTNELRALQKNIRQQLISLYTEPEKTLTEEEINRLCWCYIQSGEYQEGIEFFNAHPEYYQDTADWHKQMAILNMSADQTEEALKETAAWRQCLMEEAKKRLDETEPDEHLTWNLALSAHIEARTYHKCYTAEARCGHPDPDRMQQLAERALEWHDQALKLRPERTDFLMHKLTLLKDMKEDRKVIDLCEEILRIDPSFFWPYAYMQEAYEHLQMGQEVVDTFYRAKRIFAGNSEIHVRAARVFADYRQYEDLLNVVQQAEDADVVSPELLTLKVRALCRLADGKDQKKWAEADDCAEQAIKQLTSEQADPELLAKIYLERAYLMEKCKELHNKQKNQMLSYARKSLEIKDTINIRYFLGRYYIEYDQDYEKAYGHLKICEEQHMDFPWTYFYIARCKEKFKEPEKALSYYEKVMELNPDFRDCLWRMGLIWRNKFNRTLQTEYADKALYYLNQQEERFGIFTDLHRWRSYIWLSLGNYEKALAETQKGLEREEDSGLWILKGRALRKLDRYEESIKSFEESIHCEDRYGNNDIFCYGRIFQCFLALRRLREGIAYFEQVFADADTDKVKNFCLEHMADLAFILGDHKQAFQWIEQWYGRLDFACKGEDTWERTAKRVSDVLSVQLLHRPSLDDAYREECRQAAVLAEQAARDDSALLDDRVTMCQNVGELYYYMQDWETAWTFFQKAYHMACHCENYDSMDELLEDLMKCSYWRKDLENARKYGEKYREKKEETYKECSDLGLSMEELMTRPGPDIRQRLHDLFYYAYFTGQYEKARYYAELSYTQNLCWWCHEGGCTEEWEMRGMLAFLDHQYEEARKAFENANHFSWLQGTKEAYMMLRMLSGNGKHV